MTSTSTQILECQTGIPLATIGTPWIWKPDDIASTVWRTASHSAYVMLEVVPEEETGRAPN